MIDPIPSGTRDVLPDEMRELRAITEKVRAVFDARGYGEVATPALEYESTLARGDAAAAEPAYRLFDEQGNVLVLRSDMTIPIARVVATRYATSAPPLRFCYFAHAYRSVRPQRGQAREMLQAGIELVGAPGPDGTIEAIELLCDVLDSVGLDSYRVGLGDASLYPALLDALGVPVAARAPILHELVTRDFVGLEREIGGLRLGDEAADLLLRVPQLRGGPEVLELPSGPAADVVGRLKRVHERLSPGVAERIIFDLGLSRSLGYYTGAIFEVYDGALGVPLGGGGRYDDLLARFGRELPAAGWALNVERLHIALVGESRGEGIARSGNVDRPGGEPPGETAGERWG
jgi:ATP phosphoribosyltransferase regulatory subunit